MRRRILIGAAITLGALVVLGIIGAVYRHHQNATSSCVRRVLEAQGYTSSQAAAMVNGYPAEAPTVASEVAGARFQCGG